MQLQLQSVREKLAAVRLECPPQQETGALFAASFRKLLTDKRGQWDLIQNL